MNKKLTTIDLFAGVGGIKIAFEREGFDTVFSNDIDSSCKITYDLNSDGVKMVCQDINEIPNDSFPKFDILLGGFPCQPFSIAGHRKGFQDEGRGDLFFKILGILKDNKPSAFLLENVKNMVSHEKGETMKYIVEELEKIGYNVTYRVLNTCEYGNLPQNRERVYIVGMTDKKSFDLFKFPEKEELKLKLEDVLEKDVADKYYYTPKSLIYNNLIDEVIKYDTAYQWNKNKIFQYE
jgi:DNA (cytosine-5)-methyltransferase 1